MSRPRWSYLYWWRDLFWRPREKQERGWEAHLLDLHIQINILRRRADKQDAKIKELTDVLYRHIATPPTRPFEWDTKR